MGCLKLYDYEYIRIKPQMSKKDKQNKTNNGVQERTYTEAEVEQIRKKYEPSSKIGKVGAIVSIVSGILSALVIVVGAVVSYVTMKNEIDDLSDKVDVLIADSSEMQEFLYEDDGVKDQLGMINEALNIKVINVTDEVAESAIEGANIERKDIDYVTSPLTGETCIGVDTNGNVYIAKDLIGETVLLTYKEDDKEVYFLGQYNENYHWDGYCVTNAYNEDGTLYGICESNFDDGNRLDYISLYSSSNNEWIYAKRTLVDGENVGITTNYYIDNNDVKNFTSTNVRITDILYADEYISKLNPRMTKYYTGNTVNNNFSDSTGNAYEVTYNEDGTIRMLYVGRFADGYCNDATGEAFSIVYSDKYNAYFYNSGKFSKGKAEKHSTEPITIDEINDIINGFSFDCDLNWKKSI